MRRLLIATAVALLAAPLVAAPAWLRMQTPHFTVSGDVDASRLRNLATRLEAFRDAIGQLLPGARPPALMPTFVVVFDNEREFAPFKPIVRGKPAPLVGYVTGDRLTPCIALSLDGSGDADLTVFHEYAHLLLRRPGPLPPLWFEEGAAEFYSTIAVARNAASVRIGRPVERHLIALRLAIAQPYDSSQESARKSSAYIPLTDLLEATVESPQLAMVYAESWALVHYLLIGNPARTPQLRAFLDAVQEGQPPRQAFAATLRPVSDLDRELRLYVRAGVYAVKEVPLGERGGTSSVSASKMSGAEVVATQGRLLMHLERDAEAAERLAAAIAADPEVLDAQLAFGLLRMRQERPADAVGPLRRAAEIDRGNVLIAYDYGLSALNARDASRSSGVPMPDETLAHAHDVLQAALPESPSGEVLGVLGALEARLGRLDAAERTLRRARAASPGRLPIMIELANVYTRAGKVEEALKMRVAIDAIR